MRFARGFGSKLSANTRAIKNVNSQRQVALKDSANGNRNNGITKNNRKSEAHQFIIDARVYTLSVRIGKEDSL